MSLNILIAVLISIGLFALFGINPITGAIRMARGRNSQKREHKQTAGEFMRRLEGKKRDNLVQRSLRDTHNSLVTIGQEQRYKRVVRFSILSGAAGVAGSIFLFSSPLLAVVLGLGCALVPLWMTNLSVYAHTKQVNRELETALSMVTISYIRQNDIVKAVTEAAPHTGSPVKQVLQKFLNMVNFIDGDIEAAIRQMKLELDNTLFHQWCDILILCQSDHTLKAGLLPVVNKISELKIQQDENETQMMLPLQNILQMAAIVCIVFPMLYVFNAEWYSYLVHTLLGQISIGIVAVLIFWSIHKAIKLSKPIEYKI